MPLGKKVDPYLTSKFSVQIGDIEEASFAECSGLEVETEVFEYQEGGVHEYVHKLPGRSKVSNITLKWGITDSREIWDWYRNVVQGTIERKNVSVVIYDLKQKEVMRWSFRNAYPVKWTGPAFKADENAITIETLELAHEGMILN